MLGRAKLLAQLFLALPPIALALACSPALFGSTIERDMAKTAMDIERIYQVNADTQKVVETRLKTLEIRQQTQSDLALRSLAELEQRVAAMQETLDSIRNQVEEIRFKTLGESPDRVPIRVGSGDHASTVVLEGEQLFLDGQKALQRKDYAGARSFYQEFLKQFAGSPRAADAQMWIGESYYREGKWKEAKAAFVTVEQQYVASPRLPEALMKMALCDQQTGQNEQAAATLERLIAKYPSWDQIEQAQEMLRNLPKGGPQLPPGPPR